MPRLRIGLLGGANIARQFTAAVSGSEHVSVVSVASRSAEKAAAFARECGIPGSHGSYEALLADPGVDAIYLPLPNNLHAEWAIKALAAGKHVLCEKPLALHADQVRAMFTAAKANNRVLAEGYPWRAQPRTALLSRLLGEGAIGSVKQMTVSFSAPFSDPTNIRMKPEAGGGALLDLGTYCVSFLRLVAGARPTRVHAVADWAETGVDRGMVATLEFPGGMLATLNCSFAAAYQRSATVHGETGSLSTSWQNHTISMPDPIRLWRGGANVVAAEVHDAPAADGFRAEAESFAAAVSTGPAAWTGATAGESLDIALTLDAIAESARTGARVDLPSD